MTGRVSVTRHGMPVLAAAMLAFATWSIASKYRAREVTAPPIAAPTHPYDSTVAGTGIVEPRSEVIALAIERGGVVSRVHVVAGDQVKAGRPLFAIDPRNYEAAVAEAEASVAAERAAIASIDESIVLQRDLIDQARAELESAEAERTRASLDHARYATLVRGAWTSRQRYETATADVEKAGAGVAAAKAALASARQRNALLDAGHREAEARLARARARLDGAKADLDKSVVRAPIDGAILKVNVRLGEYAQAGVLANPLMTIGSVDPLHVRVDIDEADAWRVHPSTPAVARLRGNPGISVRLSFVRFEPYVLPKRSLSGDTMERVDMRVLQAIYAFAPADFPAFIGQQVDVFVEAPSRAVAALHPTSGLVALHQPTLGAWAGTSARSR
jgi:HlyD family secretion protein